MKRTINLLKNDLKNILREPIFLILFTSPVLILLLLKFAFPIFNILLNRFVVFDLNTIFTQVSFMFLFLIPMLCGMIWSLLLVDDKDNKIMDVISVTPLGKNEYINIKLLSNTFISFILVLLMYFFQNYNSSISIEVMLLLILLSIQSIYLVILVANFASNKIEAMTFSKIFSFVYMFPLVTLLLKSNLRYFFSIFPQYWVIESYKVLNQSSFWMTISVGYIYNFLCSWMLVSYFKRK